MGRWERPRGRCRGLAVHETPSRMPTRRSEDLDGPLARAVESPQPACLPEGCREWHRAYSSLNPQKGKSSMYSPTLPGLFSLLATSHSVLLRSCVLRGSSRFQLG